MLAGNKSFVVESNRIGVGFPSKVVELLEFYIQYPVQLERAKGVWKGKESYDFVHEYFHSIQS